jgi:hypothetical protein
LSPPHLSSTELSQYIMFQNDLGAYFVSFLFALDAVE